MAIENVDEATKTLNDILDAIETEQHLIDFVIKSSGSLENVSKRLFAEAQKKAGHRKMSVCEQLLVDVIRTQTQNISFMRQVFTMVVAPLQAEAEMTPKEMAQELAKMMRVSISETPPEPVAKPKPKKKYRH